MRPDVGIIIGLIIIYTIIVLIGVCADKHI